jgi:hypothetical protein
MRRQGFLDEVPHCRVPVRAGTLVVFSNFQVDPRRV